MLTINIAMMLETGFKQSEQRKWQQSITLPSTGIYLYILYLLIYVIGFQQGNPHIRATQGKYRKIAIDNK